MTAANRAGADAEDMALARALCHQAGVGEPVAATRLSGGRNNRVCRVDLTDGGRVVLKRYHHDPRDPRDRLGAEWSFLAYAAERSIAAVPRPLARRVEEHAALYTFAEGRKLAAGEVGAPQIAAALDLVRRMNAPPRDPTRFAAGSEACFTIGDHLGTVARRIARLASIDLAQPHADVARAFVADRLTPCWEAVSAQIVSASCARGMALDVPLPERETCISPSDFGYHNALADNDGHITFIDFEYAGRDDPAKLVCDFFCQPEIPVPQPFFEPFAAGVADALELHAAATIRMRLLLDAYRIKWVCIMLNEFLAMDAARRAFADQHDRAERRRMQLEKAQAALGAIPIC